VFRYRSAAFFVYGFAKKDLATIDSDNLRQLRKLAKFLLEQDETALNSAIAEGKLIEVNYGKETVP
jgi:hypothetical protein